MSDFSIFKKWASLPVKEQAVQLAAWLCDVAKAQEEPHGSNNGFWVYRFLKSAGINYPAPWCASFVTYVLKESGYKEFPARPAAVIEWARWAEVNHRITDKPERGDLFYHLNADGTGHIGFVIENKGETLRTIEGNSNDEGDREGYEVCRRERNVSGCKFIRL